MVSSGQGKAAAPKAPSGHACTGNERRIVAGISSFAFQVSPSAFQSHWASWCIAATLWTLLGVLQVKAIIIGGVGTASICASGEDQG